MLRIRDRVGLVLLVLAFSCWWVPTAQAFLLFWFTAGANQGGTCACPFSCTVHPMGGDPENGGGGPPQGSQNQHRPVPLFLIVYP